MKKKITLAIETAIGYGGLSLFENKNLIDVRSGNEKISRSDRLLPFIREFLAENKIEKKDLSLIAVSLGPGNFTGARIGLATAIGLKEGLGVPCAGISVFRAAALTESAKPSNGASMVALLSDGGKIIYALCDKPGDFKNDAIDFQSRSLDEFISELAKNKRQTEILLENRLFELLKIELRTVAPNPLINSLMGFKEIENELSTCVGKAVLDNYASDNVKVYYLNARQKLITQPEND
jgi:tRNA threonylcarbamoyladenosine biosynthesis protein TsaB